MIDIANDNLDNELNIQKYNELYSIMKDELEKKLKEQLIKEGSNGITKLPKKYENKLNEHVKSVIFKNGGFIDNKQVDKNNRETFITNTNMYNPKELEYWKNIFPTKTDSELEEYRTRWGKENPKYLKFERL